MSTFALFWIGVESCHFRTLICGISEIAKKHHFTAQDAHSHPYHILCTYTKTANHLCNVFLMVEAVAIRIELSRWFSGKLGVSCS